MTLSSLPGINIGHCKAAVYSNFFSKTHRLKLSLITKSGSAPERWTRGLSVMLEKIVDVVPVTKLHTILLTEEGLNCYTRLILRARMIDLTQSHGMMLEKIYSKKRKMRRMLSSNKALVYSLTRQLQ